MVPDGFPDQGTDLVKALLVRLFSQFCFTCFKCPFLTLGAHAQEGYGTCPVCVCVSVPTLASTMFVSTVQVRYVRLSFRLYSIFNLWIFDKAFRSKVTA